MCPTCGGPMGERSFWDFEWEAFWSRAQRCFVDLPGIERWNLPSAEWNQARDWGLYIWWLPLWRVSILWPDLSCTDSFHFQNKCYGTRNVLRSGCLICEKCAEIRDLQRAQYVVKWTLRVAALCSCCLARLGLIKRLCFAKDMINVQTNTSFMIEVR